MSLSRTIALVIVLCLAGTLNACALMSQNPIGPESAATSDPKLWGSWRGRTNLGTNFLHILPRRGTGGRLLDVIYVDHGKRDTWHQFEGYVTALPNGRRYVNLRLVSADHESLAQVDRNYPERSAYPYSFLPYTFDDDGRLQVGIPPSKVLREAVEAHKLAGTMIGSGVPVVALADSSVNISKYLESVNYDSLFFPGVTQIFDRVAAASDSSSNGSGSRSSAPDGQAVEFLVQSALGKGVRFQIPREYLRRGGDGGLKESVWLYIEYPEMRPEARNSLERTFGPTQKGERLDPDLSLRSGLNYRATVVITSTVPDGTSSMIHSIITNRHYSEYSDDREPGFRHFRFADIEGTILAEYLIPEDQFEGQSVWVNCPHRPDGRSDLTLCTVNARFGDRLGLSYTMPRPEIAQWRIVGSKMRAWARTLITDCFEGSQLKPGSEPSVVYTCQF
jgi:hypothetical protein